MQVNAITLLRISGIAPLEFVAEGSSNVYAMGPDTQGGAERCQLTDGRRTPISC